MRGKVEIVARKRQPTVTNSRRAPIEKSDVSKNSASRNLTCGIQLRTGAFEFSGSDELDREIRSDLELHLEHYRESAMRIASEIQANATGTLRFEITLFVERLTALSTEEAKQFYEWLENAVHEAVADGKCRADRLVLASGCTATARLVDDQSVVAPATEFRQNRLQQATKPPAEASLEDEASRARLRTAMNEIIKNLPPDFQTRRESLVRLTETFRDQVQTAIEAPLNEFLKSQVPETFEEKKSLTDLVTESLSQIGLAIRCPGSGDAGSLMAAEDRDHPRGRFLIMAKGAKKADVTRAKLSDLLPLELMPAAERREALVELRKHHARKAVVESPRNR